MRKKCNQKLVYVHILIACTECSKSMEGKRFQIARAVTSIVINTLTKQDYVNVICASASYWNEIGEYAHFLFLNAPFLDFTG